MLNAPQVNTILGELLNALETQVATLRPLAISSPEVTRTPGVYGSVILGALFTGEIEGKLTLTLEWVTAFMIAEEVTRTKVEGFTPEVKEAVETVFLEAAQGIATGLLNAGMQVEIRPLPTLVDTDVLLGEEGKSNAIKIPITHDAGVLNLFLSF